MSRLASILFCLVLVVPSAAQKNRTLEKRLDHFWKSKNQKARMIAGVIQLHAGDTVADIGTADGWFVAALSTFADSVTFYLEDINSEAWNREVFDSAFQYFANKNQTNLSHQFFYVKGTETSTTLPWQTFHTVFIIDTYHHFDERDAMLADAIAILKPGGKIVMLEALARRPGDIHQGCRQNIYSEQEIIDHMQTKGMKLEERKFMYRIAGRKNKLFVFSRT